MNLSKLSKRGLSFLLALLFSPIAFADPSAVLASPLIAGASVSDDYLADSPGKFLARRFNSNPKIIKKAQWGAKSYETFQRIKDRDFEKASTFIGIDLFFWDSTTSQLEKSQTVLKDLIAKAKERGMILILADIPLLWSSQKLRGTLNEKIRSECARYSRCHVFGLSALYDQVKANNGLRIGGQ